jgi:hypothetical protein
MSLIAQAFPGQNFEPLNLIIFAFIEDSKTAPGAFFGIV